MRSIQLNSESLLLDHIILDFKTNVLITIYQIGDKFAFRYLASSHDAEGREIDPISDSDRYNWAWGPFNSPQEAKKGAQEFYLNHGIHKLSKKTEQA